LRRAGKQPDSAERAYHRRPDRRRKPASASAWRGATRIRIGIHSGSATIGNIGAPGRLNYTIIGDTVNIGQRLEQFGKELHPDGTDVSILISPGGRP